jgi:phosphoesterase RecJ-like protein
MSNQINWDLATQAVHQATSIIVVTHIHPDGDAFGSMLGLANALRALGKQVDCAVDGGIDDDFRFLPNADQVHANLHSGKWDLLIATDAADEGRIGESGAYAKANSRQSINVDHHITNTEYADINVVAPNASSAAEVVYSWVKYLAIPLTRDIAQPLLTGMVTDTLGFRTSNVTPDTLSAAQQLLTTGISLNEITERTLDNRAFNSITLWKHVLSSVELHEGGVIFASLSADDFKKSGLHSHDDYGLVSFLIKINEARIAIVLKETDDGRINASMRAKPGYSVIAPALALGGGGHTQASGATTDGSLAEVKAKVLPLLIQEARNGKLAIG